MHVRTLSGVAAGVLALSLTACGSSTSDSSGSASAEASAAASGSAASEAALTLVDGWCKSSDSMPAEYKTMTGCFGTLKNTSNAPVTVKGGMTDLAHMVEMHETVKGTDGVMKMQPAAGGFTIPAGGSFELKPGANHVMLMELKGDLKIGDPVKVTLDTSAGELPISFQARAFDAANETYVPVQ